MICPAFTTMVALVKANFPGRLSCDPLTGKVSWPKDHKTAQHNKQKSKIFRICNGLILH